ncbi:MAG TPA: DUF4157 domain-containing protein, partial [Myxococcota bacterium]|nr:DUF4157 domain-containing protein [Myxococcota bacterium]
MRATSTPATPEATRDAASTTRTPAAAPIVEEHVALAHGQESKAVFLHRLREDLHRAAEEELAGSVWAGRRLPWLEQLVDSYERRSAADLLREAQGWLGDSRPSDAVTLRARIVERTRAGIQRWRRVGESGAEAPASVTTWMTDVLGGAILARDAEGPGPPRADLQAFGPLEGGEGLSGPIRERAHASLGAEASRVRLHRGIAAERIAERHAARALTVGHHIVLGRSAPPPDTLAGRALLAHELVHVGQQARGLQLLTALGGF